MDCPDECALDLRKIKLLPDLQIYSEPMISSISFCFSSSARGSAYSEYKSLPPPFISPSLTRGVLATSYTQTKAPSRPFKAYSISPTKLTTRVENVALEDLTNQIYCEYQHRMLFHTSTATSAKIKRSSSPCSLTSTSSGEQEDSRDTNYWERRRKNNEAAKRSRDARRAKEDEITIRAAYLEQENLKLKFKIVALSNELKRLRCILYTL